MPKRPRQHVLEDTARARLHHDFSRAGWTVENLQKDYGEDLLVRIFEAGLATPWSFYVQSKATDRIQRLRLRDGMNFGVSLPSEHVANWATFWEPVVITVYDAVADVTYWEVIQSQLESRDDVNVAEAGASLTIHVPTENLLDAYGLQRLRNRTRKRFERFDTQREGARVLAYELNRQWGVVVEYDPEAGILVLPEGRFVPDRRGGSIVTAFGPLGVLLGRVQEKGGLKTDRDVKEAVRRLCKLATSLERGEKIVVSERGGTVMRELGSLADLLQHHVRLEDEDE
jgi:Domain of unknown function (DUF4365)